MKIRISVQVDGMHFSGGACVEVPELLQRAFAPLKTGDAPVFSALAGEVSPYSETAQTVLKLREDAAQLLAKELTKELLGQMRKHDTHNGYAKESPR